MPQPNGHSSTSWNRPKDIIIVGGSLGGLFTGVALKQQGYNTTILERNPTNLLDNQGAGIVAGGDTLTFFERYDRCKRPIAVPAPKRMYLDQSGKIVQEMPLKGTMTSWDLCYYVLRANYDHQESAYCEVPGSRDGDGEIDYRFGCTFKEFREEAGKIHVTYENADGARESVVGDMLVGADGPSSTVRKILCPEVERKYAGYCVIRGTVPEDEASEEAKKVFVERFTFFHAPGIQNLTYTIPGLDGAMEPGKRLLNFVWYTNFPEDGQELEEVMTDIDGKRRRVTIPPGMMRPSAWEMVKKRGRDRLPPQMSEMVEKTKQPFVQCITDVITPTNNFYSGKVVLVGDALAGFRPHTVASTSQAAFDVLMLVEYLKTGDHSEFVRRTMEYARLAQQRGVQIGDRSQFDKLPLQEYVDDRTMMSIPRQELEFPEWTQVRV